ncbi:MAG: peptide/nickel transport system substrate-binding protein [Myxococcota bacterium]
MALVVLCLHGCAPPESARAPAGVLVVSKEQQASWVRNFNPLLPGSRWPSSAGIYEPLLIFDPFAGEYVPWLATSHRWLDDAGGVRFVIREGVRWSDGVDFTASDVKFTFDLILREPALDTGGVGAFIESVELDGEGAVVVRFRRPYSPGLDRMAHIPIVAEHIWSLIEKPAAFSNPDPVGTGPFTEILRFDTQLWELGRNADYWQPGRPAVEALRFPALPSNEQAALALITGEVDWAANFIPAIDRIFVARDPEHNRYWFPQVSGSIFVFPNLTRPPLDDPRVRKALSLAIDRELVVDVAMYGYTSPSTPSGLSDGFSAWRDPALEASIDWVEHDLVRAGALLDEAGYRLDSDGIRRRDGEPLSLVFSTISGWSDWVLAAQVISQSLRGIGVPVAVKSYDSGALMERVSKGDFDIAMGWTAEGPTPYAQLASLMDGRRRRPLGEPGQENWHRYDNPEVTALFEAFEQTGDLTEQRRLLLEVQSVFAEDAPAIPLFLNPTWGQCSTRRFVGFPSAADPYARLSPNNPPETLLVMTRIEPRPAPSSPEQP